MSRPSLRCRPSTAPGTSRDVVRRARFDDDDARPPSSSSSRREAASARRFRSEFPNLPGFGGGGLSSSSPPPSSRPRSSPKNQSLTFVNGIMMADSPLPRRGYYPPPSPSMSPLSKRPVTASAVLQSTTTAATREVTTPNDVTGRYSLARRRADRESSSSSGGGGGGGGRGAFALPFCPDSKLPPFLEHDRRVLLFDAYYVEDVHQSAVESSRLHVCEIYYYVEDGTVEILRTKVENGGLPHGVFLRRSRVERPESAGARSRSSETESGYVAAPVYYDVDDFKIGNEVEMCGRKFRVVDCNDSTRRYVREERGWHDVDLVPLPFPRDSFAEHNRAKMSRESGVPGVDRKRKMNDLKEVMESMLGRQVSTADRGSFLERGQDALCFHLVWDDRQRLYGDMQFFRLFYYLADGTVEILPIHRKNDGRDRIPKLLKRTRLPKDGGAGEAGKGGDGGGGEEREREYYSWEDFAIGDTVDVFGREMRVARCDKFTRDHYVSRGVVLDDDEDLEPKEEKVHIDRTIPPYNGFGSEEDSLRSCSEHLNPPPPMKDLAKMREKQGVIMRFNAHMLSKKTEDETRRFVIQYFMEDDTMAIREPPIRNSGVMGGNFLLRQVIKKFDGTRFMPGDMYVGNVLNIVGHRFVLLNADEYTYRLMENDERTFPYSNFGRLHEKLASKKDDIKQYFVVQYSGDGTIDVHDFTACLKGVGLRLNKQETITLWRKIDRKGKGRISFTKVVKLASDDPFLIRR